MQEEEIDDTTFENEWWEAETEVEKEDELITEVEEEQFAVEEEQFAVEEEQFAVEEEQFAVEEEQFPVEEEQFAGESDEEVEGESVLEQLDEMIDDYDDQGNLYTNDRFLFLSGRTRISI